MVIQLTNSAKNHQLTNAQIWSADSSFIFFDTRDSQAYFTGKEIGYINIASRTEETLYTSANGSHVGVVTCSPVNNIIVFIQGPEFPDSTWQYELCYRRGVLLTYTANPVNKNSLSFQASECSSPQLQITSITNLDGFCEYSPYIPGVLHGGSHVHMFCADGSMISFTYDDYLLNKSNSPLAKRNVAIAFPSDQISFKPLHPRQYVGTYYCSLVSSTAAIAAFGTDEIEKAYEECWIGVDGYIKSDGTHQKKAIAFVGDVRDSSGHLYSEIFVVDLPDNRDAWETACNFDALGITPFYPESTAYELRKPTAKLVQRRLTYTQEYKGIYQKTRHWLRSSPCGQYIAFLMQDQSSVTQLWLVHTASGNLTQLTYLSHSVDSAFTWHPQGEYIGFISQQSIYVCHVVSKKSSPLTEPLSPEPNPEACVFSPCGKWIAFTRDIPMNEVRYRQVFITDFLAN
ncbi:DUF3748 domain-containing protein [Thorsellia kenyensis]|uniref:DUF3748 domain-containing protein n=1 Tax=Thorsellia kenyensis TaxID=1549888 RepID=A0ABV6CCU9_9GAMM